ncbi:nucleotidyltransferase family protein [Alkalibacterium pelagium]|uniref:Glucose-1-phosphate thymidylyltransferase n=1 Tax=Alkalibacterium pelagium TaxID=426702 RepID=A0A1H7HYM8_9LACT|nr:nucleotidyltransferase family protein [Alkalibacterium pelagium]GEN50354.1 hypothetical protein APE02nite_10190 [Alkalibacterium pelagium]SEK53335.1 glucose-1-phosphate thymidylyltransferase [Alkalibacterium pelagium]
MKAIILAAGYATRLYPLTKDRPKPLLEVAGKSILDHIIEKMMNVSELDEIIIVTNDKFTSHFEKWLDKVDYNKSISVVNDGTLTNDTRLGAIGDIQYVIDNHGVKDDLMILAGDNLFDFELSDFADYFNEKDSDCITAYLEENKTQLKRAGVVKLDNMDKVLSFEEKPQHPKSSYCVPAFYLYKKETLPLIRQYLDEGHNPDAPGHFVPYLLNNRPVHAYRFEGKRYDIGTVESYERVKGIFEGK